jgi:hypothetical protein
LNIQKLFVFAFKNTIVFIQGRIYVCLPAYVYSMNEAGVSLKNMRNLMYHHF